MKKKHNTGLTRVYQVVSSDGGKSERTVITRLTRDACEKWLEAEADYSDYMSNIFLTIKEVWTNASPSRIKEMVED